MPREQRKRQLESQLAEEYELLRRFEEKHRYSDDPREQLHAEKQIEKGQTTIARINVELTQLDQTPPATESGDPPPGNPFFAGGRINDPALFFGRRRLVREVRGELRKRANVSLVGESEMGKSSLLYYLYATREEWLADARLVYVDLQLVWDLNDFCQTILEKLDDSGDSPTALKRALLQRDTILLLDEVEQLADPDFNPKLQGLLRALGQERHIAMCLATRRPLIEVFPPRDRSGASPLHNIFAGKQIGPFTAAEARNLVRARLAATGARFTDDEIERLMAESEGHPAQLQRRARALFREKME